MFGILRNKTKKQQQLVDVQEAYNLWDILVIRNKAVEHAIVYVNYIHDIDFVLFLKKLISDLEDDVITLEKELKKYSIKGPDKYRSNMTVSHNSEIVTDEFLSYLIFTITQETVEALLRAIRTTTTNDSIRNIFITFVKNDIERTDFITKYLKLKGWLEQPPLYKYIPPGVNEIIDSGECFHLWDHLTFRYDNLKQTEIYYNSTYDGDFKAILKSGNKALEKQVAMLEKEVKYFGIPLPKRPSDAIVAPENTELIDDDYMYRILLSGLQGASLMHAQAIKQSTTNERVRGIFKQLLYDEIDLHNKFILFGKTKGWLNPAPNYKSITKVYSCLEENEKPQHRFKGAAVLFLEYVRTWLYLSSEFLSIKGSTNAAIVLKTGRENFEKTIFVGLF